MYGEYRMSLRIPSTVVRQIEPDDITRMTFMFSKDERGRDVVHSVFGYKWVDRHNVVLDEGRRFGKDLPEGQLRDEILTLRSGEVINTLLDEDGFS